MTLLERHTQLAELIAARRDAQAGRGSVVLVVGDAGAGKTSLIKRFTAEYESAHAATAGPLVLWGLCDELLTPRSLGPFRDMFSWLDKRISGSGDELEGGRPGGMTDVLGAVVSELGRPPHPTVAVVEDAHWADAASLDAIRFIGRRIARVRALLVVSYRDDVVPPDHPLRLALGAIAPDDVRRIRLPPLSPDAVATLAGRSDIDELYSLTGGNPFYVRELLATPETDVPATVQDAVMARIARLSPAARECVEVVSAVPRSAEPWLLTGCGVADGVDEALRYGVLIRDHEAVRFGHEIARRAVEHSLPEHRRRALHDELVGILIERAADPARITHHAAHAGRGDIVAGYAPAAARRAVEVDGHAEAVEHFAHALEHADRFSSEDYLDLAEGFIASAVAIDRNEDACVVARHAIGTCREAGDRNRLGRLLCKLSYIERSRGHGAEADAALAESISVLEDQPAGEDLVSAYAERSRTAMLNHQYESAIEWGERAIALSRTVDGSRAHCGAMVTVGSARMQRDPDDSAALIEALDVAVAHHEVRAVARAYVNLAAEFGNALRYDLAREYIERGLEFAEAHDLLVAIDYLLGSRAVLHLEQGRWAAAESDTTRPAAGGMAASTDAVLVLALLEIRRGDPAAPATVRRFVDEAERSKEAQCVVPAALAVAELAWLRGEPDEVAGAIRPVIDIIHESRQPLWVGEAALRQHRIGRLDHPPADAAEPYALLIGGRWKAAAAEWEQLGRPYDQADALACAPEPAPLFHALEILDGLGAVPLATIVRQRLAHMGVTSIPRGPRPATLANPAGLTVRQTEVLELLAQRLTYQQIAERLHVSVKTVDHHVAAVRAKLDVSTRDDAVAAGRRLGIVPAEDGGGQHRR